MSTVFYQPNNIEFRVKSSEALAVFKQQQAFYLNEVRYTLKYPFEKTTREFLLANYDIWFKFLLRLESHFLAYPEVISPKSLEAIQSDLQATLLSFEDLCSHYPQHFDPRMFGPLQDFMAPFSQMLNYRVSLLENTTVTEAFKVISVMLGAYLQNYIFVLQELDNLVFEKEPAFLSLHEFDIDYMARFGSYPCVMRAIDYRNRFGVRAVTMKNYTEAEKAEDVMDQLILENIAIRGII